MEILQTRGSYDRGDAIDGAKSCKTCRKILVKTSLFCFQINAVVTIVVIV